MQSHERTMGLELKFVSEVQGPMASNESTEVERDLTCSMIGM